MNRQLLDIAERDEETVVVLYYLPDNPYTPYATWVASRKRPEHTYWGHYFQTLEEAQDDFDRRSFGLWKSWRLMGLVHGMGGTQDDLKEVEKEFRGY